MDTEGLKAGGAVAELSTKDTTEYRIDQGDFTRENLSYFDEEKWKKYIAYSNDLEEHDPARNMANRIFAMSYDEALKKEQAGIEEFKAKNEGRDPSEEELAQIRRDKKITTWAEDFDVTKKDIDGFVKKNKEKPTAKEIEEQKESKFFKLFKEYEEKYLVTHIRPDLDAKCGVGLFKLARVGDLSIKFDFSKDVEKIPHGQSVPGKDNIDTGGVNGVKGDFNVGKDGKIEYSTTSYKDHHDPELSKNNSSATKWVYDGLVGLGFIKKEKYLDKNGECYLDKLVEFVTQIDNKTFPDQAKYFDISDRTALGLARFFKFEKIVEFFKDGRNPVEVLSDEDLWKYGLIHWKYIRDENGKIVKGDDGKPQHEPEPENKQKKQAEIIKKSKEKYKELEAGGYVLETRFGKILVDIGNQLPGGYDAALGNGVEGYLIWTPSKNGFFFSAMRGLPSDFELNDGFRVRETMWRTEEGRSEPLKISLREFLQVVVGGPFLATGKLADDLENEAKGALTEEAPAEENIEEEAEVEAEEEDIEEETEEEILAKIEESFKKGAVWVPGLGKYATNVHRWETASTGEKNVKKEGELFQPTEPQKFEVVAGLGEEGLFNDSVAIKDATGADSNTYVIKAHNLIKVLRPEHIVDLADDERKEWRGRYREWIAVVDSQPLRTGGGEEEVKEESTPEEIEADFAEGSEWVPADDRGIRKFHAYDDNRETFEKKRNAGPYTTTPENKYYIKGSIGYDQKRGEEVLLRVLEPDGNEYEIALSAVALVRNFKPAHIMKSRGLQEKYEEWTKQQLRANYEAKMVREAAPSIDYEKMMPIVIDDFEKSAEKYWSFLAERGVSGTVIENRRDRIIKQIKNEPKNKPNIIQISVLKVDDAAIGLLSAYKQLALLNGFEIGDFRYDSEQQIAAAPINISDVPKKKEDTEEEESGAPKSRFDILKEQSLKAAEELPLTQATEAYNLLIDYQKWVNSGGGESDAMDYDTLDSLEEDLSNCGIEIWDVVGGREEKATAEVLGQILDKMGKILKGREEAEDQAEAGEPFDYEEFEKSCIEKMEQANYSEAHEIQWPLQKLQPALIDFSLSKSLIATLLDQLRSSGIEIPAPQNNEEAAKLKESVDKILDTVAETMAAKAGGTEKQRDTVNNKAEKEAGEVDKVILNLENDQILEVRKGQDWTLNLYGKILSKTIQSIIKADNGEIGIKFTGDDEATIADTQWWKEYFAKTEEFSQRCSNAEKAEAESKTTEPIIEIEGQQVKLEAGQKWTFTLSPEVAEVAGYEKKTEEVKEVKVDDDGSITIEWADGTNWGRLTPDQLGKEMTELKATKE